MRSHLANLLSQVPPAVRRSLAREYLQIYLLRLLHEAQAHSRLAFVGGTALRLLHGLPRYSEDLDFCAAPQPGDDPLDLAATFASVGRGLVAAGYRIKITAKAARAVSHALYRFEGLPRELGWSTDARVALSIKIEVDTAPPAGARL
ncbi:MAG: nucleotidyl transferase AbiEii/AbiGii toxin family protein [Deltaproteobacteria bacterium]|nr:nucleotidyl transferase AbiEii/AbiGii toxin family protein [Deltaproteobacteria bacterium]